MDHRTVGSTVVSTLRMWRVSTRGRAGPGSGAPFGGGGWGVYIRLRLEVFVDGDPKRGLILRPDPCSWTSGVPPSYDGSWVIRVAYVLVVRSSHVDSHVHLSTVRTRSEAPVSHLYS